MDGRKKTLMERLVEAGYPKEQMDHHYSDLYIDDTSLTRKLIDEWCRENGYVKQLFVKRFSDQITRRPMFDIAFQYDPFWEEKCGQNENLQDADQKENDPPAEVTSAVECTSEICVFNPEGICRFPDLYGEAPESTEDGCWACVLKPSDNDWQGNKHKAETIHCFDCKYLTFSDCYGECGCPQETGHGLVNPNDTCCFAEKESVR